MPPFDVRSCPSSPIPAGMEHWARHLYIRKSRCDRSPDTAGTLTILVAGTAVATVDASATSDADYTAQSADVSAFADGASHILEIRYEYADAGGSGLDGNLFIDDVTIDATAARTTPKKPATDSSKHFSKRGR